MNQLILNLFIVLLIGFGCVNQNNSENTSNSNPFSLPKYNSPVNDYAGVLLPIEENEILEIIKSLEDSIGSQIAILIIDSMSGMSIDEYSMAVANFWLIGREDYDDGILITLAMKERNVRIEVGYGLELIVEDHIAKRIIDRLIIPNFKKGDYYKGIKKAVIELIDLIYSKPQLIGQRWKPAK